MGWFFCLQAHHCNYLLISLYSVVISVLFTESHPKHIAFHNCKYHTGSGQMLTFSLMAISEIEWADSYNHYIITIGRHCWTLAITFHKIAEKYQGDIKICKMECEWLIFSKSQTYGGLKHPWAVLNSISSQHNNPFWMFLLCTYSVYQSSVTTMQRTTNIRSICGVIGFN
jgi:hypothetical protein